MRRYFSENERAQLPKSWDDDVTYGTVEKLTVYEKDGDARFTGILDADGNRIMTRDVRNPIGYFTPKE